MRIKQSRLGTKHFYEPIGVAFRIIGASESPTFGRCFVVEAIPRERTLRADGFEFATPEERDCLWESLHKKELKRLAANLTKEKHSNRKRRLNLSDIDEHEKQEAEDRAEHDAIWSGLSSEYEPDVFETDENSEVIDESLAVESQIIGEDE